MAIVEMNTGIIEGAIGFAGKLNAESTASNPIVYGATKWLRATYLFSEDGGLVSTIALTSGTPIPLGAVILGGLLDVVIAPTSGGAATVAIRVEGANDIILAAAVSGAPWSTTGRKDLIPAFTGSTSVKTTAARNVSVVIAVAALTAGQFDVYLAYVDTV